MDSIEIKDNLDDFMSQFASHEMQDFIWATIQLTAERFSRPYEIIDPDEAYDIIRTQVRKLKNERKRMESLMNTKEDATL